MGLAITRIVCVVSVLGATALPCALATDASDPPAPEGVSVELWETLLEIDAATREIEDFSARFEKFKHTPLLRKPMRSQGRVRVKGEVARWDTDAPHPSTTLMRDGEVQIYEPADKRLEIYDLGDRLDVFGASPLPRMTEMADRFTIEQQPAEAWSDDDAPPASWLSLRLTPNSDAMREHIGRIELLLDPEAARLARLRIYPAGERSWSEYRFSDMRLNEGVDDEALQLDLPRGVEVVRPLEGVEP